MLPELQSPHVNQLPVLKADALKFLTTFRSQIPKDACLGIFERIIGLLGSESNVVHTYAAIAVERLLTSKVTVSPTSLMSLQLSSAAFTNLLKTAAVHDACFAAYGLLYASKPAPQPVCLPSFQPIKVPRHWSSCWQSAACGCTLLAHLRASSAEMGPLDCLHYTLRFRSI